MRKFDIYYNDGVYYGTMSFNNTNNDKVEKAITKEIKNNNKNINPMYRITRDNFKEV